MIIEENCHTFKEKSLGIWLRLVLGMWHICWYRRYTVMVDESKRAAAYLPWTTFKNALDQLSQGVPSRIDRSVFPGIAWNVQTQLFAGMKFLGLLSGEDEPTPLLSDLVSGTEEERKLKLKKVIQNSYSELIAIDLTKATRAHFEEKLGELYSVTGDTRIKASRFFVNAASYTGIPLSAFIRPSTSGSSNGTKRRAPSPRPRNAVRKNSPPPHDPIDALAPTGTSKTVSLASGGTLTVSATKDFFALNAADRKFFNAIIDQLEAYESAPKK
jgi:hypothetical protein